MLELNADLAFFWLAPRIWYDAYLMLVWVGQRT